MKLYETFNDFMKHSKIFMKHSKIFTQINKVSL